jgi:tRNA pseudouridine38-40 synthase
MEEGENRGARGARRTSKKAEAGPPAARRFKLTVAYDGTAYAGWQVQPDRPSVQQVLEETLAEIVGHAVKIHGSGRTDAGVHARGQVAHADLACRMTAKSVGRALNARLPPDIRVLKASLTRPGFHARRSAAGKEYRYFVWNDELILPDRRLYAAHAYRPLDVAAMREGAAFFVGRHDFASFTANPQRVVESTVRTLFAFTVSRRGKEVVFRVSGEGFLYKQVRGMVGFLLRVGERAEKPEAVKELLDSRAPRKARVPTAAAQGLFLWRVWYRNRRFIPPE